MKKNNILLISTLLFPSLFLTSCDMTYHHKLEEFTTWASEDGELILYSLFNGSGGNAKVFRNGEYQDCYWYCNFWPGIDLTIADSKSNIPVNFHFQNEITYDNEDQFKDEVILYVAEDNENKYQAKQYKESYTLHKDELDNSEIDARYCFSNFQNDNLRLKFSANQKIRENGDTCITNSYQYGDYKEIKLFWGDEHKFKMTLGYKTSSGTYYTSKTNVFMMFEEDEIFKLNEPGFFLEMGVIR